MLKKFNLVEKVQHRNSSYGIGKAPAMKLTGKEKKIDEITKRANEVKSRFSIGSYYTSQLKEATPEMLESMQMTVDPETGEVVKKRKTTTKKSETVKKSETTKKGKTAKKKEEEEEMILESEGSDSESDDVIRDNREAIRKKQMEMETVSETKSDKVAPETNQMDIEDESDPEPKAKPKPKPKPKPKSKPKASQKASQTVKEESVKKEEESDDSSESEDHYIPLTERLKMKMKDANRSTVVDDLVNTKSVVPASRKRKAPARKTEEGKKRTRVKKEESDSSDDSLFGF